MFFRKLKQKMVILTSTIQDIGFWEVLNLCSPPSSGHGGEGGGNVQPKSDVALAHPQATWLSQTTRLLLLVFWGTDPSSFPLASPGFSLISILFNNLSRL